VSEEDWANGAWRLEDRKLKIEDSERGQRGRLRRWGMAIKSRIKIKIKKKPTGTTSWPGRTSWGMKSIHF